MDTQIQAIITDLHEILEGDPWYGNSLKAILANVNPATVNNDPCGNGHSPVAILYHILNWSAFVLNRIERDPKRDVHYFEQQDWITINPLEHTWEKGYAALNQVHLRLAELLQTKNDQFLHEPVAGRTYRVGYMLRGLVQHIIYHSGQLAYLKNLLAQPHPD